MSENHVQGQVGEVRMTVSVTRKATGKVDTYNLVGRVMNEDQPNEELENGSDPQHGSEKRGD
jgi:hypothetical protein